MRLSKICKSIYHISRILLMLSMIALLSSCATALSGLQTDAQKPNPVNGIVVGSFMVEPVPEWERPSGNYWLSIWRRKPVKEYTLSLQPNKEMDIIAELPAGIYRINYIYAGKQGNLSRGHGRKGTIGGLSFEVKEGEILYIGHFHLIIAKEPEHIRRQREAHFDGLSRVISSAVFGHPYMSTGPQRPIMYTAAGIEDNFQEAIKLLQGKGWSESAVEKLRKSLITSERD